MSGRWQLAEDFRFALAATGHRRDEDCGVLIRVSYEFPDRSEVRYDERAPTEGSTFQRSGVTWHVDTVDMDTTGGYIVRLSTARRLTGLDRGRERR